MLTRSKPVIAALHTLLACALTAAETYSQTPSAGDAAGRDDQIDRPESYALEKRMNEYAVWGGASFDSPTVFGTAEDRKFIIAGLRYARVFAASERVAYLYTIDAVPLALVYQPEFARRANQSGGSPVYGAGLSPIGFKIVFNRGGQWKPFADASGGFLRFRRPVPADVPDATRFNFAFDFGGGVQIFTAPRRAVTLGYKLHHISNAARSQVNPGLDANLFYMGFSIFN